MLVLVLYILVLIDCDMLLYILCINSVNTILYSILFYNKEREMMRNISKHILFSELIDFFKAILAMT